MSFPIKEIFITEQKTEKQTIITLICQPRVENISWSIKNERYYHKDPSQMEDLLSEYFAIALEESVDIIVLPEVSIPEELIETIRAWSEQNNKIIIAGSHYHNRESKVISRCPVIINGKIFFTEKLIPAPVELSAKEEFNLSAGDIFYIFRNSPVGNFAVFICSDFLNSDLVSQVLKHELDFCCICAYQRTSSQYHDRMNVHCEESEQGIYFLYSNFLDPDHADGKSAIMGSIHRMYQDKMKESNFSDFKPQHKVFEFPDEFSYVTAKLDIKNRRPFAATGPKTKPNIVIGKFGENEEHKNFDFARKIKHLDARYRNINRIFVSPESMEDIRSVLRTKKIIFITGDPGIGKTYCAVKLLREYFQVGYTPVWFVGDGEDQRTSVAKELAELKPAEKHIYYFEDPFGKTSFERREILYGLFSQLQDKIDQVDSFIIITSRKEIFEKFLKEDLSQDELLKINQELNIINPSYSKISLIEILNRTITEETTWFKNNELKDFVHNQIQTGMLVTPLAIRSFVVTSKDFNSKEDLLRLMARRQEEQYKGYARELIELPLPTKVLITCVLLRGFEGAKHFETFYNIVFKKVNELYEYSGSSIFQEILLSQLGYRLERYSSENSAFKITHPVYEEALLEAFKNDNQTKRVFFAVFEVFQSEFPHKAFVAARHLLSRDMKIGVEIFDYLLSIQDGFPHDEMRISIAIQILKLYHESNDKKLLTLLSRFASIDSLKKIIENSSVLSPKYHALELLVKYQSIPEIGQVDLENINLDHVLYVIKNEWRNYNLIMEMIILTSKTHPNFLTRYEDSFGSKAVLPVLLRMIRTDKAQYKTIFANSRYKKTIEEYAKIFQRHKSANPNYRPGHKEFRKMILEDGAYAGELVVADGVEKALKYKRNLLPVGILNINGDFLSGEVVTIRHEKASEPFAIGIASYSSSELLRIKGLHSASIEKIIGYNGGAAAIFRNTITFLKNTKKDKE